MSKLNISDNTNISMPVRNMLAIIGAVAMGVWAYFGVTEQLNKHSTTLELMQKDLSENTEFRIKYPRGELGQSQNDLEQFMLIEDLYKSVDTMQKHLDSMANNKINIEFLNKQMDKVIEDIEKLKDADRDIKYENGNH
jgi:uncharacterized protein HemX|tara:strand:- start:427 stop:840 length:414 start_codon:yes stop_codon:yes gene_type:complete